jgi:hypothetical protein
LAMLAADMRASDIGISSEEHRIVVLSRNGE